MRHPGPAVQSLTIETISLFTAWEHSYIGYFRIVEMNQMQVLCVHFTDNYWFPNLKLHVLSE